MQRDGTGREDQERLEQARQTPRVRGARRRLTEEKAAALQRIAEQVRAGKLTVRQATPAERERYDIRGDESHR